MVYKVRARYCRFNKEVIHNVKKYSPTVETAGHCYWRKPTNLLSIIFYGHVARATLFQVLVATHTYM